jgi:hypothetical protein
MKRLAVSLILFGMLLVPTLGQPSGVHADLGCPAEFYPYAVSDLPPVFATKDRNGDGMVCARGKYAGGEFRSLVVIDNS